jgi:hypothetical protein
MQHLCDRIYGNLLSNMWLVVAYKGTTPNRP